MKSALVAVTFLLVGFICGFIYAGGMNPPHDLPFNVEMVNDYPGELNADMIEKLNSEIGDRINTTYPGKPYQCFVLPDGGPNFRVYFSAGTKFIPENFENDLGDFASERARALMDEELKKHPAPPSGKPPIP